MAQVFISYSRKDEAFAQRLNAALTAQKRECWLDRKDIEFTADWKQRVLRGIEGANVFVCVLSPDYAASTVCREEAEHAVAHNKRLVPLLRRPVDFNALHQSIAAINALPFAESDDFDAGVSKLIAALDTDFDWLDQHTRLLRGALEWEGKARDQSLILRGNELRAAEQWLTQAGTTRERNPTQLQTEFILTSRRASNRRLRVFLGIAIAVVVVTLVLAAVALVQRGIARSERQRAEQRTREVSQSLSRSDFLEATRRLAANEAGAALAHLARALRVDPENAIAQRRLIALLSQRDWQFPALDPLVHSSAIWSADFSPDGKRLVTSSADGTVQLWNSATGEKIGEPLATSSLATVLFSRDGSRIAVTWDLNRGESSVRGCWQILDGATGQPIAGPAERPGSIAATAFTGDGKRLMIGLRLENDTGEVCASELGTSAPPQTVLSLKSAMPEAFDAAGARVIVLVREPAPTDERRKIARVWNLRTGKPTTLPFKHDEDIEGAIFSPDGDRVVTWTKASAFVWDLAADRLVYSTAPVPEDRMLWQIVCSPDAKLLAAVNVEHPSRPMDWTVQLYDAKGDGEYLRGTIDDNGLFGSLGFSHDSRFLLLCSSGQRARVWRVPAADEGQAVEAAAPLEHADIVTVANMSPDGRRIVTGAFDKTVRVWQATPGLGHALPEKLPPAQPVFFMEMSERGSRLATFSHEPAGIRLWDAATRQPLSPFLPLPEVRCAQFSGDERRLITGGDDAIARVWDANDGRLITQLKHPSGAAISAVALNFDGTRAATSTPSETMLWDLAAGRPIPLPLGTPRNAPGIEFTPDGARLLSIGNGQLNLWNAATGERVWGPVASELENSSTRFSPDGRRFAAFGAEQTVDLVETATGRREHSLAHRGVAVDASFSADGRLVATCSLVMKTSGYAQVWDAATGAAITQPLVGEEEIHHVRISPDATLACATERGGGVRIWSIATGRECADPFPHEASAFPAHFSADGKRVITVASDTVQFHELWDLGGPAHSWLPDLGEAVGGLVLNDNGVAASIVRRMAALEQVRAKIDAATGDDPHLKWARWFFADRRTRTISPFSQRTMSEELGKQP